VFSSRSGSFADQSVHSCVVDLPALYCVQGPFDASAGLCGSYVVRAALQQSLLQYTDDKQ
jgi:hypothetical protein